MNPEYLDHLNRVVAVLAREHTIGELCGAVDAATRALVGHRLFTVLYVAPGGDEVARVYSSDPVSYPLAGRKRMGPTPWGDLVLRQGRHWIGRDDEDIRWAFPDHVLIRSLGLASALNVAVAHGGRVVGTMNLLDVAGAYSEDAIARLLPFGALIAPALVEAARADEA